MLPICGKTRGYYRNEVATGLEDRVFDGVKASRKQIAGLEDDFFFYYYLMEGNQQFVPLG